MRDRIAPLPNYASRSGPIIYVPEFAYAADGTVTLPAGWTYTCASSGRTTQVSVSAVKAAIGANACPWYSTDGTNKRIVVEPVGLALVKNNLGWLPGATGWLAGTGTATRAAGKVDPAGGTDGVEFAGVAGNTGPGYLATTSNPVTYQMWTKRVSGGLGANVIALASDGATVDPYVGNVVSVDLWTLNTVSALGVSTYAYLSWGNTRTAQVYGLQVESRGYPTSMFPQGNTLVQRAIASLSVAFNRMCPAGYWDIQQTIYPRYANGQIAADHDWWFLDANNRMYLQQSTGKLRLLVGGAEKALSTAAPTWSRDQALTIRHWNTPTSSGFTLAGATTNSETVLGGTGTAAAPGAVVYLLGNASGAQEAAAMDAPIVRHPS